MALSDTIKPQDREVISLKEVAERLRYLRESVKLSQVKMAEVVGVKQSSLNRYELNQASPTFETLPAMRITLMCLWIISLGAPITRKESCTNTSPKSSRPTRR